MDEKAARARFDTNYYPDEGFREDGDEATEGDAPEGWSDEAPAGKGGREASAPRGGAVRIP